ncbi:MAG: hypothetical protein ACE5K4_08745 [Candidatus Hydrothermarchaeota archaeon]
MNKEMHDPRKAKEMFDVVSEKIPEIVGSLIDSLYNEERATKTAKAVAAFYKELKEGGMSDEQAFELTKEYTSNLSLKKMRKGIGFKQHFKEHFAKFKEKE